MATKRVPKKEYESLAIITSIEAHSRVSLKLKDNFYTFEYIETREFPVDLIDSDQIDFEKEKSMLWDTVNIEVDRQVEDVIQSLKCVK